MLNIYLVIFITLVASLIASFGQLLYKKGLKTRHETISHTLKAIKDRNILMGVGAYFVSLVVYLYALSSAPLSVVYPTFASTFIFVTLISAVMLKEKISAVRALGVLVIFIGIAIIAVSIG